MKNTFYFLTILLLISCGNNRGYEVITKGLSQKKLKNGTGRGMQSGSDYFYMRAHIYTEKDKPIENPSFETSFFYMTQIKEPSYSYDFIKGLPGLKIGDSISFKTKPDSLFLFYYGSPSPAEIAGENIHLHVTILNILSESEYFEKLETAKFESKLKAIGDFDTYLQMNEIAEVPFGTGTIKKVLVNGKGEDAFYGDVVSIHMKQWLFDGTEIENSKKTGGPFEYEIGGPYGMKGMDEALMKMKEGEISRIYLPYFLAFGEQGQPPIIPPYSNLIMEIELLEIKK